MLLHLLKSFYFTFFAISILLFQVFTVLGLLVYCELFKSDLFSKSLVFLTDGVLIFHGPEMVLVGNWATVCIKQKHIFLMPKSGSNIFIELVLEIQKAIKSKPSVDIFGIVAGYTCITMIPFLLTILFVIVISDADLVFIVSFVCCKYCRFTDCWLSSSYFKIIRYFISMYAFQSIAVVGPT